jgi:hypothetical protein
MAHLEPCRPAEDLAQTAAAQPQLLLECPARPAGDPDQQGEELGQTDRFPLVEVFHGVILAGSGGIGRRGLARASPV